MLISDTSEIVKAVDDSGLLILKISMGKNEKVMWCPSFKAQKSHDPQAISDSICETFAYVDCHLRNLNSIQVIEDSKYTSPHIYIGTTKSIEQSNITPEFIDKLAKSMSENWTEFWNRQKMERMEYDIQYRYGSDCYFGHLTTKLMIIISMLENELFTDIGMP